MMCSEASGKFGGYGACGDICDDDGGGGSGGQGINQENK